MHALVGARRQGHEHGRVGVRALGSGVDKHDQYACKGIGDVGRIYGVRKVMLGVTVMFVQGVLTMVVCRWS